MFDPNIKLTKEDYRLRKILFIGGCIFTILFWGCVCISLINFITSRCR